MYLPQLFGEGTDFAYEYFEFRNDEFLLQELSAISEFTVLNLHNVDSFGS